MEQPQIDLSVKVLPSREEQCQVASAVYVRSAQMKNSASEGTPGEDAWMTTRWSQPEQFWNILTVGEHAGSNQHGRYPY